MSAWWLRCLSRLVPRNRRDDWVREWEAESACRRGEGPKGARATWIAALEDALGLRLRRCSERRKQTRAQANMLANVVIDVRHSLRALRRNPGPVLLSAVSLAVAIGATTTMISVVDAIDFRPLPYRDAGRLVQLAQVSTRGDEGTALPASADLFREWQARARSYEALGAASPIAVSLCDDARALAAARITGEFFPALGATARMGRVFSPEEVRDGASVIVISSDLWRTAFGGDPGVVGRTVSLSWVGEFRAVAAAPFTVVGVLPRSVHYPRGAKVWLPASGGFGGPSDNPMLTVLGRLRPGVSVAGAGAELDGLGKQLAEEDPESYGAVRGAVGTLREAIQERADRPGTSARFVLLLVASFVLVLATINVTVVLLVRAARQEHDLIVRAALGAPRFRLLTLTFGQSLSVSMAAGACGVLLSSWGVRLADARMSVSATGFAPVLDGRVVSAALLLTMASGLVSGLFAALRGGGRDLPGTFCARASAGTRGSTGAHLQGALVVAQVGCALVLLNGAGALARDFVSLATRDPGFDADRLIVAGQLGASLDEAADAADRIASLPGIDEVALGGQPAVGYRYRLEGRDPLTAADRPFPYRVSAGYFRTLGIPMVAGREFERSDRAGSMPVAVVSQMAARSLWPGTTPVGKRLFMENTDGVGEWVTVVGVSGDERIDRDLRSPIRPILYRPWGQLANERRRTEIFARAAVDPEALIPGIGSILRERASGEGWQGDSVVTMRSIVGDYLDLQRFRTSALTLFSVFGLILASMGVYGVVATVVTQRTAEIGIRVALGARPGDVLALVARGGLGLAVAGVALGMAGALAARRPLDALVAGSAGFDPGALLAAGALLIAVVGAASYVPGRRALRIDPAVSLRE